VPAFLLALLAILTSFTGVYLLDLLSVGSPWAFGGGL
jgi:hypothetical protein